MISNVILCKNLRFIPIF